MQTSVQRGRWAEDLAVTYLSAHGYTVFARNFRCAQGEIDLLAYEQATLCFIEVRARRSACWGSPLETISLSKQKRIQCAARHYIAQLDGAWPPMRFDALGIVLTQPPQYVLLQAAFETT